MAACLSSQSPSASCIRVHDSYSPRLPEQPRSGRRRFLARKRSPLEGSRLFAVVRTGRSEGGMPLHASLPLGVPPIVVPFVVFRGLAAEAITVGGFGEVRRPRTCRKPMQRHGGADRHHKRVVWTTPFRRLSPWEAGVLRAIVSVPQEKTSWSCSVALLGRPRGRSRVSATHHIAIRREV
jgi:hypothetical protein